MMEEPFGFALGSFAKGAGRPFLGLVQGESVTPLSALDPVRFPAEVGLLHLLKDWDASLAALKALSAQARTGKDGLALQDLKIFAPLSEARQVFCAGANYRRHVVEMVVAVGLGAETEGMDSDARRAFGESYVQRQLTESEPFVFMKPVTAIAGPQDDLTLPSFSQQVDWELELGAVIGRQTLRASQEDALSCVAGYMIVNDLTARDRVRRTDPGAISLDWVAAKGAPGFLPCGPFFVPAEFVGDPQRLSLQLAVNGEVMQHGSTSDMIFDVARLVSFISRYARLLPGDILCTGSPAGNGVARGRFLRPNDVIEAEIQGLGRQVVRCVADPRPLAS